MLTDTYGGVCPNCGYDRLLMRYGSAGYFQMDCCPNCAFGFGTNGVDGEVFDGDVLEGQIILLKESIEGKGLTADRVGLLLYMESLPDHREKHESVFAYGEDLKPKRWDSNE